MNFFSVRTYRFLRALVLGIFRIIHPKVVVSGRENIPEGACILSSNHSAFSDPIWLVGYANLPTMPRVMAKQELTKVPVISWFCKKLGCIFVNRDGNDLVAIKTAMKTLREGEKLVVFPEGTRVRDGKPSEPHIGAVLLAARTRCPIVPAYVTMHKKLFRAIHVVIGRPYYPKASAKPSPEELEAGTTQLMKTIYGLGEGLQ